jgi:hypothetical protein
MSNEVAPKGAVWVCGACGKRSKDKYGNQAIDRGWDVSCAMNSVLCDESTLVFEDGWKGGVPPGIEVHGRVIKADDWKSPDEPPEPEAA